MEIVMDYEKKYKEALELARDYYKANQKLGESEENEVLSDIFPELAESEDERIRKEIISFIQDHIDEINLQVSGDYDTRDKEDIALQEWCKKAIAWLEKQGEQKPILDFNAEDWYVSKVDGKIHNTYHSVDKVEPKFKVGDWVVRKDGEPFFNGNHYAQITVIDKEQYWFDSGTWLEAKDIKFWTIQDAKDGDVLKEDSCIFIIERMKPNGTAIIHCCLFDDGDFDLGSTLGFDVDSTYPATKEQCDLLFAKMKEAGYEWDAKNKELKKIEKESAEWSDTEKQEMFIKSQRPHFWRPSDEQMKALKYVAYHLMPDTNYRKEMFSLYEDLKKLK